MSERQLIRCKCGREVYAVPGEHTLPGGLPTCPESRIRYDQHATLVEAAREVAEAYLYAKPIVFSRQRKAIDALRAALENEQ